MNKKKAYQGPTSTFFETMALQQAHRQKPRSPRVDRSIFLGAHGDCFKLIYHGMNKAEEPALWGQRQFF